MRVRGSPRTGLASRQDIEESPTAPISPEKARELNFYIDRGEGNVNNEIFLRLLSQRTAIELDLSGDLEWEHLEGLRACRIAIVRVGSIDDDQDTLDEIRVWMVNHLLEFKRVFDPYLGDLDL